MTSLTPRGPRRAKLFRKLDRRFWPPTGDVQPNDLASAVGIDCYSDYRGDRGDAAALALLQVSGVEPQIRPLASNWPVEEGMHALVDLPRLRGGRLLHSLETCDLLIPDNPIACTRSSTRRVDTPPIQASWITAITPSPSSRGLRESAESSCLAAASEYAAAELCSRGVEP